jgi:hypothetical protein
MIWPRHWGHFIEGIIVMRRIVDYLVNNIREHFMLYIILWSLLAIMDVIYIMFF